MDDLLPGEIRYAELKEAEKQATYLARRMEQQAETYERIIGLLIEKLADR